MYTHKFTRKFINKFQFIRQLNNPDFDIDP